MRDWEPTFRDLPILDELGAALFTGDQAPAPRRARGLVRRSRSTRSLALAFALLVVAAATAGAGTLYLLRGSVIPAPSPRDVAPEQTPAPGTSRISALRAADPDPGQPSWTLRIARSRTGFMCSTVGQLRDGRFGLVGLDGRFRLLPVRIVDGCGKPQRNAASLIGARVFDARRAADVRTVVNGVAGPGLRGVDMAAGGQHVDVKTASDGAFLAVLRGYPEDLGIHVTLRFGDGHVERHDFGADRFVVADPLGGHAWTTSVSQLGSGPGQQPDPRTCVDFHPVRQRRGQPRSPAACGILGPRRDGYFFAVRRITPGTGKLPVDFGGEGHWGSAPARTAVWGEAGSDVAAVRVALPGGEERELQIAPNRAFLAVLDPKVDPDGIAVTVTFKDGRSETHHGSTNLVGRRG